MLATCVGIGGNGIAATGCSVINGFGSAFNSPCCLNCGLTSNGGAFCASNSSAITVCGVAGGGLALDMSMYPATKTSPPNTEAQRMSANAAPSEPITGPVSGR